MRKILIAGDCHGDTRHVYYLLQMAANNDVYTVVVVGDFGAWEHTADGREFFTKVNRLAGAAKITVYFIDGNHDKVSRIYEKYGDKLDGNGFLICRPNLRYIPRGAVWEWDGVRFLAFGGAYSVDKEWRLDLERQRHEVWALRKSYGSRAKDTSSGFFWFPEEEASEEEFERAMAVTRPVDVMLTHDKPRASNPQWNRKDLPECWPNQDRIQQLVVRHQPRLLVHGHLHYPYTDQIRCGDGDAYTTVIGLDCDQAYHPGYDPADSWKILQIEQAEEGVRVRIE